MWPSLQRDEGHVERPAEASADSLADQLGDCIGPVGHRNRVDADRFVVTGPPSAHDVVRAREDDSFDPGQGRGVKNVRQGIEVRADQVFPGAHSSVLAAR